MTNRKMSDYADVVRSLATFWHGSDLSALEEACLLSFVAKGFSVTVYSYDKISNLPSQLRAADASAIVSRDFLLSFVVGGKPSLSHFSDLFRYQLFKKTGCVWIDADLLCLKQFQLPNHGNILTKETDDRLNGAFMRINRDDSHLDQLIATTEGLANIGNLKWGATGPSLVTKILGPSSLHLALNVSSFYPVHWTEWWKPFLPEERESCEAATSGSYALHLWNNIVEGAGYWKDLAPPHGSYLHERLAQDGLIHLFKGVLPERTMKQLTRNYISQQNAASVPVRSLATILVNRTAKAVKLKIGSFIDRGR
jgi:hypothetical protein